MCGSWELGAGECGMGVEVEHKTSGVCTLQDGGEHHGGNGGEPQVAVPGSPQFCPSMPLHLLQAHGVALGDPIALTHGHDCYIYRSALA